MHPVIVLGTSHVFSCLSISRQELRIGFSDLDRYLQNLILLKSINDCSGNCPCCPLTRLFVADVCTPRMFDKSKLHCLSTTNIPLVVIKIQVPLPPDF